MIEQEKEALVYRLISGEIYISEYGYTLLPADARTKYRASCLYQQTVEEQKYSGWLTKESCKSVLISNGIIPTEIDNNLKELSNRIDELKLELYNSFFDEKARNKTKKILKMVYDKQRETYSKYHYLDHITITGYAEMVRQQFLIYSNLVDSDNNLVWKNPKEIDSKKLDHIMSIIRESLLSPSELREIARNDPWRSYWGVSKNPFSCPVPNLTDEQRMLVTFTKMYESISEHPKCPPEAIIEDDDALDGWMIKQKQDRDKEKDSELVDDKWKNLKGSDEVFLPIQTDEDRKRVEELNTSQAKSIKLQRNSVIQSKGVAVDYDFQDRKMSVQAQINQNFVNNAKG